MKQTTNALGFLTAQYRAIFKHAYFKGLVSAAILSAGLATGAANATNQDGVLDADDFHNSGSSISVKDETVTSKSDIDLNTWDDDDKFDKTGGAGNEAAAAYALDTVISGSGAVVTIKGKSDRHLAFTNLTVQNGATFKFLNAADVNSHIYGFTSGSAATEANISGTFTVSNKSSVEVSGGAINFNHVVINSGSNLTLGGAVNSPDDSNAPWYFVTNVGGITKTTTSPEPVTVISGTVSVDSSTINLNDMSSLMVSTQGDMTITGNSVINFNGKEGNVTSGDKFATAFLRGGLDADGSDHALVTISGSGSNIPTLNVADGAFGAIYSNETSISDAKINIGSGSTFILDGDWTTYNENDAGVHSGSVVTLSGDVTIQNAGTLKIGNDTAAGNISTVNISGATSIDGKIVNHAVIAVSGSSGSLTVDASQLDGSSGAKSGIFTQGTNNKGQVYLKSSGSLFIQGTSASNVVDLHNYTFSGATSDDVQDNVNITVSGEATIKGDYLAVSKTLTAGANNETTNVNGNSSGPALKIDATNLTLGSKNHGAASLGFASATAKNVEFVGSSSSTPFTLKDDVTLRSISISGSGVSGVTTGESGSITGDVKIAEDGRLIVDGGKYTSSYDLTMASGELSVTNTKPADVSSLILTGKLTLDNSAGDNTILVSGSGSTLDISNADFSVVKDDDEAEFATFTVSGTGATLIIQGEDVETILAQDANVSGSAIHINAGTVKVVGDLDLTDAQIKGSVAATSGTLTFADTATSTSTLEVDGILTIGGSGGTIDLDDSGAVIVGALALNNATGEEGKKVTTLASGTYTVLNGLKTNKDTDTVKLTGTTLNLGKLSDDGQTVSGGGSLANLDLDGTSKANVYGSWSGSKLTTVDGAKLTVNSQGSLTLAGTTNTTEPVLESSGLSLAANTINLAGNLILGSGVAEDISVTTSGTVTADGITKGAIDIQGGTLRIEFDSGDSFNSTQLTALKEYLFSGSTSGSINGVLHLGNGKIDGIDLSKEETVDDTGRYDYDLIAGVAGVESDVTNNDLTEHAFTTDDPSKVSGIIGGLHVTGTSSVTLQNSAGFVKTEKNNGFFVSVTDGSGKEVAADITFNGSVLRLENGGEAGDVTLSGASGSELIVRSTEKETVLGNVSGSSGGTFTVQGSVKAQDVNIKNVSIAEGNTLQANSFEVAEADKTTVLDGNLVVSSTGTGSKSGSAEFAGEAVLNGQNVIGKDLTANKGLTINNTTTVGKDLTVDGASASINGNTVVSGTATFKQGGVVAQGATFVAEKVDLSGSTFFVGQDDDAEKQISGSSAYFQANNLDLNGGTFVVDPSYNQAASIAVINEVGATSAQINGGILEGNLVAAKNSILALGVTDATEADTIAKMKYVFADYLNAQGSLDEKNLGAILYVGKNLQVDGTTSSRLIVNANLSGNEVDTEIETTYKDFDAYIGKNSAIAIDEYALVADGTKGAIHFDSQDAVLCNAGGKVLLVGDGFNTRDEITLFTDNGNNGDPSKTGVLISGSNLRVETLNGLFGFTYNSGEETYAKQLALNTEQIDFVFNDASAPVKDTLISYAARDNNWDRGVDETAVDTDTLHGSLAKGIKYDGSKFTKTDGSTTGVDQSAYVKVEYKDGDGKTQYHVYHAAFNSFLDYVTTHEMTGRSAEQVARLGVYGGAAQAALSAGATTSDAISGRMGVGAQYGSITFADNGQGAGLWLAPIYKSHDSDGFASQGPSYGVDMSMYGLALGGDFTMSNGLRVGGAFNLGSGDADGQSMAAGVSNDFSYVGFSVYGGFSMDKLSIVGDISYTIVDNDVEANTTADKVSTSFDSSSLSVGLTGQYALDVNGLSVVPHAGLRYTTVDMDDYTVKGAQYNEIAQYGADGFNVFSIPVGVTVAKEIVAGSWTVKPAFDLTLTANMGDDTVDGTVTWTGLENHATKVQSEVVDSFTYGATLGVSAKSGNMSFGFGVNYTGASSADEYGVQANARFVF